MRFISIRFVPVQSRHGVDCINSRHSGDLVGKGVKYVFGVIVIID